MSSTYQPDHALTERQLAKAIVDEMGSDFEMVSVAVLGRRVVLHGMAPSYMAKAQAEARVRGAGYEEIDNRLRVVPGLDVFSPYPRT